MPDDKAIREFVLAELRCALLRTKCVVIEFESAGDALKQNLVSPADVIKILEWRGLNAYIDPIILAKLRQACGVTNGG